MKTKKTLKFYLGLLVGLTYAVPTLAADSILETTEGGLKNTINQAFFGGNDIKITPDTFILGLFTLIGYLLTFTGVIFFLILLYAGYLWMFARGNESQVEKAKNITREVIIGILIIVLARVFVEFVISQLGQAAPNV